MSTQITLIPIGIFIGIKFLAVTNFETLRRGRGGRGLDTSAFIRNSKVFSYLHISGNRKVIWILV